MCSRIARAIGSSPRGRGKRTLRVRDSGEFGLIPARAGKTPAIVLPVVMWRAHPRAGGENSAKR